MIDIYLSSNLEDNVGHPMAPYFFTASLFHCMQVSLAEGGTGFGTCWGWQTATRMLEEAGFADVGVVPRRPATRSTPSTSASADGSRNPSATVRNCEAADRRSDPVRC